MDGETLARLRAYCDARADREWERLDRDPYHRLEFAVNWHFVCRYLPPGGRVLYLGSGSVRYAIALARRGHEVVLADISPAALALAAGKARQEGVADRIVRSVEASATDLGAFGDGEFDGALVIGPLTHLVSEGDRRAAVSEVWRVLSPGAPVFASFLARYSPIRNLLRSGRPEAIAERPALVRRLLETGIYHAEEGEGWPDFWFARPEEILTLMEGCGFETDALLASHGIAAFLETGLNAIADPNVLAAWRDLVIETCQDEGVLGMAEHLLYIGREPWMVA